MAERVTRISINPNDPGYRDDAGFYDVFYRGMLLIHAITADEEENFVLCWVLDDKGQRVMHSDGKHYLTETKRGEVHIRKREKHVLLN